VFSELVVFVLLNERVLLVGSGFFCHNGGLYGLSLCAASTHLFHSTLFISHPHFIAPHPSHHHLSTNKRYKSRIMQVTSLLRFSNVCPFLGHSSPATLRALAKTHGVSNMSSLTARALSCPMMGPQLAAIGQARAYASVAGNKDIAAIHNVRL
jgi:hypothetical protein